MITRDEAFAEINRLQDEYVDKLIELIHSNDYTYMKMINFTSPTGTGKTKMMSKLINKLPQYYFIITTLSKGQLHMQIRDSLIQDCNSANFFVYGSADYKINSKLDAEDIIGRIPKNTKCIWLRDEGHIATNRYDALLHDVCYKVINFSATNAYSDIQCNFTQTMMLRTVNQQPGTPEEAILKLEEIKKSHKDVPHYNPCAIFRCVSGDEVLYDEIVRLCRKHHLTYIDISDDTYVMQQLCEDDDEHDVIINKFKIVEGIDIRRAHVLYMDNQPANNATTIQVIGRCRRNALLYRSDIDILSPENRTLLRDTRECYVYYNVVDMKIDTDVHGELYYAFCDQISCESLKAGTTVFVEDGVLPNGLKVMELSGQTGTFLIQKDENTGFNYVSPSTAFYEKTLKRCNEYLYIQKMQFPLTDDTDVNRAHGEWIYRKIHVNDVMKMKPHRAMQFCYATGDQQKMYDSVYYLSETCEVLNYDTAGEVAVLNAEYLSERMKKFTPDYLASALERCRLEYFINTGDVSLQDSCDLYINELQQFKKLHKSNKWVQRFYKEVLNWDSYAVEKVTDKTFVHIALRDVMCDSSLTVLAYALLQDAQAWLLRLDEETQDYGLREGDYYINDWRKHVEYVANLIQEIGLNKDDEVHIDNLIIWCTSAGLWHCEVHHDLDEFAKLMNGDDLRYAFPRLDTEHVYGYKFVVTKKDIDAYIHRIEHFLMPISWCTLGISLDDLIDAVQNRLAVVQQLLADGVVERVVVDYSKLFQDVSVSEKRGLDEHELSLTHRITYEELRQLRSYTHDKVVNDRESAIIGFDLMRPMKIDNDMVWVEASAISQKIGKYNKLNAFITQRYSEELALGKAQCFTGKNSFNLDKKCNAELGYCVEYYSKYLVYGDDYLGKYLDQALREAHTWDVTECIVVRACMLKYRAMMMRSFGQGVSRLLKTMSITTLIQNKYQYFVNLVVALGTQTATYVLSTLYPDQSAQDDVDPNLSIRHISGLADYITHDTILDVKVRNNIDENCVRQVLAYHYLSTKRSDLNIKRVIVYDAVSDRAVEIDISDTNLKAPASLDAQLETD